jgi:hypothetical protein
MTEKGVACAAMGYRFSAALWMHTDGAWHFITLPHDEADEIDELTTFTSRGFGSVRVRVTVGRTTWSTSIFPDTKRGSYILPVKKQVRTAEGIAAGDMVDVQLELVDPVG